METPQKSQVTEWLKQRNQTGRPKAVENLMPLVYEELRRVAHKYFRNERPDHTLQPTALVHEAYLRLVDQTRVDWQGRTHFFAVCANAMRRVLIDYARQRQRAKRGGDRREVPFNTMIAVAELDPISILTFNEAIEKLKSLDERQAQVVELRIFGGMRVSQIAEYLGVSKRTVEGDWRHAKAWLRAVLRDEAPS